MYSRSTDRVEAWVKASGMEVNGVPESNRDEEPESSRNEMLASDLLASQFLYDGEILKEFQNKKTRMVAL